MNIKNLAAGLAAVATLAAPLALAAPAEAKPSNAPCVRITAPGSHTVGIGESVSINIRTSEACKNAKVVIDGQAMGRVPGRELRLNTAFYLSGEKTMKIRVKAKGHTSVTKTLSYRVGDES